MATTFLTPRVVVAINGIERRTVGGSTSCGFRSAFSTARVQFPDTEDPPTPGDLVTIALGYLETGVIAVFAGEVDDHSVDYWPNYRAITCSGFLARTQRGLGVASATADPDPETGETPAYYAEGIGDADIVEALLTLWGVPIGELQAADPAVTLGTIEPITLGQNEPAWGLIQELDRLTFMRTFDAPDGTARRLSINGIPSSAALTLTEGVNILSGSLTKSRRGIVNSVTAVGLADAGGPGVTPRATRQAPSPYIPTPPTYQSEEWQTRLIETEELADQYAALRVGQMNRLQETVQIGIERGRPDIQPAMSIAIDSDALAYDDRTVFWVEQVEHQWDARSIRTTLSLLAATGADGLNPNQAPIPVIDVKLETEYLADGSRIWIAYADGSSSYDPDGTAIDIDPQHGIATYLWGGSTAPLTPVGKPRATYEYASDPTGETITLTVTDTSLKAGSATVTLTAKMVEKAGRRDLWAAVDSDLLLTTTAGQSWMATGVPARVIAEMAHPEYQLAADSAGDLYRVTIDAVDAVTVTPIASPSGVTALHINLGPDGKGTGRCWAGCADGSTWLSPDDGQTWFQRGTIAPDAGASGPTIRHIEESPFSFGTLYALSGNAMWLSYDEGLTWESVRAYPDPALDAVRMASGRFADLSQDTSYHWAAFAGTSADTEQRLLEQEDFDEVDWPVADKPAQPTGLTMGVYAPELFLSDANGTGKVFYIEDFTGGGNLEARTYDAAFGLPRHIVRDGLYDGIVVGAAVSNLFKTTDKFLTIRNLRDLDAPQTGYMIAFGRVRGPIPATGNVIWVGCTGVASGFTLGPITVNALTQNGFARRAAHPCDGDEALATGVTFPLLRVADGVLMTYSQRRQEGIAKTEPVSEVNCYRSTDGGLTWQAADPTFVAWLATDGAGTVYALCWGGVGTQAGGSLRRSDDGGATWATVFGGFPLETAHTGAMPSQLVMSPVDPDTVALRQNGWWLSTDGGASFAETVDFIETSSFGGGWRGGAITPAGTHVTVRQNLSGTDGPFYRAAFGGALVEARASGTSGPDSFATGSDGTWYGYSEREGAAVLQSADDGASWSDAFTAANLPAEVVAAYNTRCEANAFLPGDEGNGWFWFAATPLVGVAIALGEQGAAPPAGAYQSLQTQLDAAFPDGAYWCVREGAVRIEEGGV